MTSIKTSIPELDRLLDGGIAENSLSAIFTDPGLDCLPMVYQILYERLKLGDRVLFVTNFKDPERHEDALSEYGFKIKTFKKKFNFLDSYSTLIGKKSRSKYTVKSANDVDNVVNAIEDTIKKTRTNFLVFDSLSTAIDLSGGGTAKPAIKLKQLSKKLGITSLFTFTKWPYSASLLQNVRDVLDAVIELRSIQRRRFGKQYFKVSKMAWGKAQQKSVAFNVVRPGGVKAYIPKILVSGPFGSGKTSFILSASEKPIAVKKMVGAQLDVGKLFYKGFELELIGTHGTYPIDPLLRLLGNEAFGALITVDVTSTDSFNRAKQLISHSSMAGIPFAVCANKCNWKGAHSPAKIRLELNIPKEVPIIPIKAQNKKATHKPCKLKQKDVQKVLDALFKQLFR